MNITKEQWTAILKAFLVFVIALAAAFGYDVGIKPMLAPKANSGVSSQGVTRFTSDLWLQNSSLSVDQLIKASNGAVGAPSVTFSSDTDTGLYRVGANNIGMAVGGALVADFDSTGLDMNNLAINNVGSSGTDFGSGGLAVAGNLTVTTAISDAGSLSVAGAATLNGGLTVDGGTVKVTATNITATTSISSAGSLGVAGTLSIGGVEVTGGCKYGVVPNVTEGGVITHGIGTAPTVVFLSPVFVGDSVTQTVYVSTTSTTLVTVGLGYPDGITTIPNLYWMACK